MPEAPKQIAELIAKFDQNLDAYYEDAIKAGGATKVAREWGGMGSNLYL